jgi:hypothetical protein
MNDRERKLVEAYGVSWPRLVDREQSPGDVLLTLFIEGFEPFSVRLLTKAAPAITQALTGMLPLQGHFIHSAWSGCGVRGLESIKLAGVTEHENSTYFPAPGDFCYTVGHDELTIFYGDACPTMPSGKVRESVAGVIAGRLPEFQRACILTRLTGARPFSLAANGKPR